MFGRTFVFMGGSPGLVVMGGDSCSEGRGFESQHHILCGNFSHIFVVKICNVCLKRPKINKKRPGLAHFKNNNFCIHFQVSRNILRMMNF